MFQFGEKKNSRLLKSHYNKIFSRGQIVPTELLAQMSIEDPITKLLKDGKDKMGTSVQKTLLTQLSGK